MSTDLVQAPTDLESEVPAIVSWARGLSITTPADFEDAADRLKQVKGMMERVKDFFAPMLKAAHEAHKRVKEQERKLADPLAEAETLAKRAMLSYQQEQQRRADAERARLQSQADEQARREREALEKRADKAKKPETKERLEQEAASIVAPCVVVETASPRVSGVVTKAVWKAEITDLTAFMAFACANLRYDLLLPNEKILQAFAKGLKEQAAMPGIKFFAEQSLAAGRR